jgi:hypothetical protein
VYVTAPAEADTCNVKILNTVYTYLSILGNSVTFGVGLSLIILSWVLKSIKGRIQGRWGRGATRNLRWILDGRMQLLRQLYEKIRPENLVIRQEYIWDKVDESVPILSNFAPMAGADEHNSPRYTF